MTPGLMLVEGLPGSGKSTTAQWLCHTLEAAGIRADWHHEQDVEHPVYNYEELQASVRGGADGCEAYHAAALDRWRDLVTRHRGGGPTVILDSSFLQVPITSMLLAGCGRDAIARQVVASADIVAPLSPLLIVLRHAGPDDALEQLRAARGPWFDDFMRDIVRGTPYTFLDLMREQAKTIDQLLPTIPTPTLRLDVGAIGWDRCRAAIAARIDVPMRAPEATPAGASALTGRYRDADSDQELIVAADHRGLFLEATGTRLLPRGGGTFELEGLSITVAFEAARMRLSARLANIGPVWVKTT